MNSKEDSDSLSSPSGGRGVCVSGQALWQWRSIARQQAIAADISADEVDWLLQDLAGIDRLSLRLETFKDRPEIRLAKPLTELTQLWQQRLHERVPVQYLTGVAPWRQFLLKVSPSVLIPRPETECLIDLAIAATHPTPDTVRLSAVRLSAHVEAHVEARHPTPSTQGHWADLGTGSGAIAIGLAFAFPEATIHAVDYSTAALAIARINAEQLRLTDRIQFYEGSWLEPLAHLKGQLSGIVANPPYIPSDLVPSLQPEVAHHEPHLALDGGVDGLDCIRQLVMAAPDYLQPGGVWLVEMMAGQAPAVASLLQQQGSYRQIQIYPDLAGIERFALAFRQ